MLRRMSILLLAFSPITPAWSFCSSPSFYGDEPTPPSSFQKPDAPYCLSGYRYTRSHSCDQWELDQYIDEVNDYINDLNNFVDSATEFANAAIEFQNEAARYAQCEAEEAKSEIE